MFVGQYLAKNLFNLDLTAQTLSFQKINKDRSEVEPACFISYFMHLNRVDLEPLFDEGFQKGNDVEEVQSGVELNQNMA